MSSTFCGFLREVHQFRRARLHAVGHFVGRDARLDLRVARRVVPELG